MQPGQVDLEIYRAFMAKLKDVNDNGVVTLRKQAGDHEAIAAVVSFSAKNGKVPAFVMVLQQPFIAGRSGTLHEVDRRNGFLLNGVFVPGSNLFGSKNLHPEI